jgi:hypothetical protein
MNPETRWQRAMINRFGLDPLFAVAQVGLPGLRVRVDLKPTQAEIDHAVASISVWRDYLPPRCVAAMIKDGWQWST